MEARKPRYQIIDGVPRRIGIVPAMLRENLKFRAGDGDLVQSSYPKSGSHWVQYITQLILKEGEPMKTHEEFAKDMRVLDYMKFQDWKSDLALRAIVTFQPLSRDTITEQGKYVYVARNPWDVCVSFFHMVTNLSMYEYQDATFEEFVNVFLEVNFGFGDYFQHVASGYALRDEPNVFFVTYEELKKDTRGVVLRLAYFLGEKYGSALEKDDELLKMLLERCKPESMRDVLVVHAQESPDKEWRELLSRTPCKCKVGYQGDENKYALVRSAKVGEWRQYFTPELLRRIERRIRDVEDKSSFMDMWKEIRAETIKESLWSG